MAPPCGRSARSPATWPAAAARLGRCGIRRSAGGILLRESAILLCRRAPDRAYFPDVWDVPGGHCQEAETPAAALCRELLEEIGVQATSFSERAVLAEAQPERFGDSRCHLFIVHRWLGEPALRGREHTELRWVPLPEAAALDLAHPIYPALFQGLAADANIDAWGP